MCCLSGSLVGASQEQLLGGALQATCGRTDSVQALLRLPALLSDLSTRKYWDTNEG